MTSVGRGRGYAGRRLGAGETKPGSATASFTGTRGCESWRMLGLRLADADPGDACIDPELKALIYIDETYRPILDQLERLTPGEDGIALNRKLTEIESIIANSVSTQAQMCDAFRTIRAMCLLNEGMATKCSIAMSTSSLSRNVPLKVVSSDKTLRNYYLNVMEETFGKLDVLEKNDPQYLVNAASMLGTFYGAARLADGSALQLLALPLLGYCEALLRSESSVAHYCLATQLMQNGRQLLAAEAQKTESFSLDVHQRTLSFMKGETLLTVDSSTWLLLAVDLCMNRFVPLPMKLQHFYAKTLGLAVPAEASNFLENQPNNAAPPDSYNEVVYGSWKSDGQNSTAMPCKVETEQSYTEEDATHTYQDNGGNSNENAYSASNASVSSSLDSQTGARKPRPILGAGARLIKARNSMSEHAIQTVPNENAPIFIPSSANDIPSFYPSVDNQSAQQLVHPHPDGVFKQPDPPQKKTDHAGLVFKAEQAFKSDQLQWKYVANTEDSFRNSTENIYGKQASEIPLEFKPSVEQMYKPTNNEDTKAFLAKRYDMNSWRQVGDSNLQDAVKGQAFQNKIPAFDPKRENWRKTDRNGSFSKEQGANWRNPQQTWGDEDAKDTEATTDPASDAGFSKYNARRQSSSKENGQRWDRTQSDAGWRDKSAPNWDNTGQNWDKSSPEGSNWDRGESPQARTLLSAPRNTNYWDHDDRFDRDYDE